VSNRASTDVVVAGQASTALTIELDQTEFTSDQVAVLSHLGVDNASEGDLKVFFHVVKRTKLDPFARQIYMIGRNTFNQRTNSWETKQTIQTGIDGYRLIGRRAADVAREPIDVRAPNWAHHDSGWRDVWLREWGNPVAARITVMRNGHEFTAVALFDEYAQTKRDGGLTSMWAQRPAGQIAKCAEALAWRMAFPQDLAGLYVEEELQHADFIEGQPSSVTAPVTAAEILEASAPVEGKDAEVAGEQPATPQITPQQEAILQTKFKAAGITTKAAMLRYAVETVGHSLASARELDTAEADAVIAALESLLGSAVVPS